MSSGNVNLGNIDVKTMILDYFNKNEYGNKEDVTMWIDSQKPASVITMGEVGETMLVMEEKKQLTFNKQKGKYEKK